jgi:succinate dehydrogenase / fumarate reductase cytochrome b subunit
MVGALSLYQTSIGKKVLMAVTGLILFGYTFIHMYGNLHVFDGREHFNEYAHWLREVGYPLLPYGGALWIARVILLLSVVGHIWAAWQVTKQDWDGRPIGYDQKKMIAASYAARTMRWSGVILALFIVYHLLHFTTGTLYVEGQFNRADVYANVVNGFRNPIVSLVYIVSMIALGLHLYHGVWSMSQTLGWRNAANNQLWRGFATVMAIVIAGGNIAIPLAVLAGIVRP